MTSDKSGKRLLIILPVVLLVGACIWFALQQFSSPPEIRHIVLISLDTTRADHLSCYGYDQPTTPVIDALADQGFLFKNAMTPVPLTLPGHTSMLTGTIPPHHGKRKNSDVYFDPAHVTLAQLLKTKGYQTGAFVGAQVLNRSFGLDRGFDTYQDEFSNDSHERSAEDVNRAAFSWLENQQTDESVFLFMHYYDPHDEYEPPEPFATQFADNPYAGEIAYTDYCIGQVVDKLKSLDMYDSTLIIVTGDHGEMLGEHGELTHMFFIYQSALKVPLVWKLPGSAQGQRFDELASIIDIVPTVCDLLDIVPPAGIEGKNLAGFFGDQPPPPEDRYLYCESMHPTHYGANSLVGLASNQWKYIHTTRPELYDLQQDPGELNNLVESNARQASILNENLTQISELAARQGSEQKNVPLDPGLIKHLQSLGYVGETSVHEDTGFEETKEDPKDLVDYHNSWHKAEHLVIEKKFAEALAVIDEALEKRPGFVLCELATRICLSQQDYDNAIRYGKMAVEQKPGNFFAHEKLAFAYSFGKQDEAAAEQYQQALKFMPEDHPDFVATRVRLHFQLAMTRSRQEKYDLAITQFNEALRLNPNQPALLDKLASLLLDCPDRFLREPSRALELAKQACSMTQMQHPEFLRTLAVAHADNNDFDNAVSVTERAMSLAAARGDQTLVTGLQKQLDLFKRKTPLDR